MTALFRRRARSRSRWPLAIRIALIAATLCIVALAAFVLYWRVHVDALVARIRAAGDPTLPSEIVLPPARPGADPAPWLDELMRLDQTDDQWWDIDAEDDEPMLARARANAFPPDVRDAIETLHECRRSSADWSDENWGETRHALNEALAAGVPQSQLSDCQRAVIRAWNVSGLPCRAVLERACGLTRRDSLRGMEAWKSVEDAVDAMRFLSPLISTARVFSDAAAADAFEGRSESCVNHLRTAMCVARVLDAPTSLPAGDARRFSLGLVSGGLRRSLPYLPREADLHEIDDELRAFDARESQVFALKSERARIGWIYDWFRNCTSEQLRDEMHSRVPLAGPLMWLFLRRDEAVCLERFEEGFAKLREPYWKLDRSWLNDSSPTTFPKYALVAAMLTPNFRQQAKAIVASEAELALARCALTARRRGADAARAEAAHTIDPYSGKPLQCRIDANGMIVLWSVGANGHDDGGSSAHPKLGDMIPGTDEEEDPELPLDIVWRVRTD